MTNVWFALGLTVFAGLATGVGSAMAFFAKRTNYRFLSVSTGFSAGVMLYVSFARRVGPSYPVDIYVTAPAFQVVVLVRPQPRAKAKRMERRVGLGRNSAQDTP
jgi:zinc transporter ZupT